MKKLFIIGATLTSITIFLFFFTLNRDVSTVSETNAYQKVVSPHFALIKQELPHIQQISCNEGNRNDCISYTISVSKRDPSYQKLPLITDDELRRLKRHLTLILQAKQRHLTSRTGLLTFFINTSTSTKDVKNGTICRELGTTIECDTNQ